MLDLLQVQKTEQTLILTQRYQQQLNVKWNSTLENPMAFAPSEKLKQGVTLEEVIIQNTRLGDFASGYLKQIFEQSTKEQNDQRMTNNKKFVAVGFGRGYDSRWLKEAIVSGYHVWWLDVSDVGVEKARIDMREQYEKITNWRKKYLEPIVRKAEIRSILFDPKPINLDLHSVEIWYFCRTLTCLSELSATIVLRQIGAVSFSEKADSEKNNKIVIISAMRDHNMDRIGKTSKLYPIKKIISDISRGAGRPVEVVREASCMYFDQKYSALTIKAT